MYPIHVAYRISLCLYASEDVLLTTLYTTSEQRLVQVLEIYEQTSDIKSFEVKRVYSDFGNPGSSTFVNNDEKLNLRTATGHLKKLKG